MEVLKSKSYCKSTFRFVSKIALSASFKLKSGEEKIESNILMHPFGTRQSWNQVILSSRSRRFVALCFGLLMYLNPLKQLKLEDVKRLTRGYESIVCSIVMHVEGPEI